MTADKQIVAVYADRAIVSGGPTRAIDLVNATAASQLVVEAPRDLGRYEARATGAGRRRARFAATPPRAEADRVRAALCGGSGEDGDGG